MLLLGHESIETTNVYLHANLAHEREGFGKSLAGGDAVPPLRGKRYSTRFSGIALTALLQGAFRMLPAFCLSPDPMSPNLVPAAYVTQDFLFKCNVLERPA